MEGVLQFLFYDRESRVLWKGKNSPNMMAEIYFKNHQENIILWGMAEETGEGK